MTPIWHLGNDVVDLGHHGGSGKARDQRFLARVCSVEEVQTIGSSRDSDTALWIHWAAKEAIYKSASKALGTPPIFHHPLFHVAFLKEALGEFLEGSLSTTQPTLAGTGHYKDIRFSLSVERSTSAVHAVSWIHEEGRGFPPYRSECQEMPTAVRGPASGLEEHFSATEWECVTHQASGLTRIRAREALAEEGGIPEEGLEIRCGPGAPGRRIPSVWIDGVEAPVDLTLSHHGRFLAFAFLKT